MCRVFASVVSRGVRCIKGILIPVMAGPSPLRKASGSRSSDSLWGFRAHHHSAHAQYPSVKDGSVSVLLEQSTCATDRQSSGSACTLCALRGALLFRGAVTKDGTWHSHPSLPGSPDSTELWCPFPWDHCQLGIQLRPGGRPAAPEAWETRGDSHSSPDLVSPKAHSPWRAGWRELAEGGRGAAAPRDARVVTEGAPGPRCPALPRPWWPQQCPPSARPGPAPSRESRSSAPTACFSISISSSSSSSFPPSHPRSHNRFRLARQRGSAGAEGGGSGAACSGTDCPILRQGPGPGPGPRIYSRPAGSEQQGRAAAAVRTAPTARLARGTAPRAASRGPPLRPVPRPTEKQLLDLT
ncbi:Src Substrate Cortactin [Manis pentadactyla]|nr:Src Substrate Cortactin [Manis pentadactyla]